MPVRVTGPLEDMQVEAGFVWLAEQRAAVVEMASASGLPLLGPIQRNPLVTTTYGTGQLIRAALQHGAEQIVLAIGGSATVDGGVGAAMALGWRFLDHNGQHVRLGGGRLSTIQRIIPPASGMAVPVRVLCDVDNPLCGEQGAARVYGPQKGATAETVEILEAGLAHLAEVVKAQLGLDVRDLAGAGAAGGLAAGAVAFMDGRLVPGVDEVMAQSRLPQKLAGADWVITGEGRFDSQSLRGKVVSGVTRAARQKGVKVAVIAGQVCLAVADYRAAGVETALACMPDGLSLDEAMSRSESLLIQAARRWAHTLV